LNAPVHVVQSFLGVLPTLYFPNIDKLGDGYSVIQG
jgi:hypothetical protein